MTVEGVSLDDVWGPSVTDDPILRMDHAPAPGEGNVAIEPSRIGAATGGSMTPGDEAGARADLRALVREVQRLRHEQRSDASTMWFTVVVGLLTLLLSLHSIHNSIRELIRIRGAT